MVRRVRGKAQLLGAARRVKDVDAPGTLLRRVDVFALQLHDVAGTRVGLDDHVHQLTVEQNQRVLIEGHGYRLSFPPVTARSESARCLIDMKSGPDPDITAWRRNDRTAFLSVDSVGANRVIVW